MFFPLLGACFLLAGLVLLRLALSSMVLRKILVSPLHFLFLLSVLISLPARIAEQLFPQWGGNPVLLSLHYIGILFLVTTWLCLCLHPAAADKNEKLPPILLLYLIPVVLSVLIATNGIHRLFWQARVLSGSGLNMIGEYTSSYYLFIIYAVVAAGGGLFIHLKKLLAQGLYSAWFTFLLALCLALPTGILIADYFTARALAVADMISLFFSLLAPLFFYFAFYYYPFADLLPDKKLLAELDDPVVVTNKKQRLVFINQKMLDLLKKKQEQVIGRDFKLVFPELNYIKHPLTVFSFQRQVVLFSHETYDLNIMPVINWAGRDKGKILIFHDITQLKVTEKNLKKIHKQIEDEVVLRMEELRKVNEMLKDSNQALLDEIAQRKKAEKMINAALDEKNILIGEIHHRVKNNLQIIISLLNLQRRYFEDEYMQEIFRSTVNRIRSIGMIHEKLYKTQDLVNINIAEYINDLAHYLLHSFEDKAQHINLDVNVEKIFLDLNRSILCGLIINELVSNSIKHAFPATKKGNEENVINISFIAQGPNLELLVGDNGIGMPQNINMENQDSLGMKIIATLVKQLKSSMEIKQNKGTQVKISFPKDQPLSDSFIEHQGMLNRIQEALNALPKKIRKTTLLYYLDGKTVTEVSEFLGISTENVQSQLQLARKHLKDLLTKSVS